jgi:hypothetical protein
MNTVVAGYIAAWRPTSVPAEAACFARQIVATAAPAGRDRAMLAGDQVQGQAYFNLTWRHG